MVNIMKLSINPIEAAEDTPFLAQYFPNIFAEALVPLNPQRWPAYLAGSAMASSSKILSSEIGFMIGGLEFESKSFEICEIC